MSLVIAPALNSLTSHPPTDFALSRIYLLDRGETLHAPITQIQNRAGKSKQPDCPQNCIRTRGADERSTTPRKVTEGVWRGTNEMVIASPAPEGFAYHFPPARFELWIKSLSLSPKSKSHLRGMLSLLWDYAMWRGDVPIERNPMELVRIEGASRRERQPRSLTAEQFHSLLSAIDVESDRLC